MKTDCSVISIHQAIIFTSLIRNSRSIELLAGARPFIKVFKTWNHYFESYKDWLSLGQIELQMLYHNAMKFFQISMYYLQFYLASVLELLAVFYCRCCSVALPTPHLYNLWLFPIYCFRYRKHILLLYKTWPLWLWDRRHICYMGPELPQLVAVFLRKIFCHFSWLSPPCEKYASLPLQWLCCMRLMFQLCRFQEKVCRKIA